MFVGFVIINKLEWTFLYNFAHLSSVALERFLRDRLAGLKGMYALRLFDVWRQNSFLPGCSLLSFHQQCPLSIPRAAQV